MSNEPLRTTLPRMLIVDDEEWFTEMVQMMFHCSYETVIASDGQAALEVFNREHFDVIITDVWMPRMDGIKFVTAIRRQGSDVPVLIVSGIVAGRELGDVLNQGPTSF